MPHHNFCHVVKSVWVIYVFSREHILFSHNSGGFGKYVVEKNEKVPQLPRPTGARSWESRTVSERKRGAVRAEIPYILSSIH